MSRGSQTGSAEPAPLRALIDRGREAQLCGDWDQALTHFEAALDHVALGDMVGARPDILRWTGDVCRERGELEAAQEWVERSCAEAEAADLKDRIASALNSLGAIATVRGDLELAASHYTDAQLFAGAVGDQQIMAMADQNLGTLANIRGNAAQALMSYRSALQRYRQMDDGLRATRALNNMGMAHVDLEEWDAADRCFAEAAGLAELAGDAMMVGRVELNRAELHLRRHRYDGALTSVARSLEVFNRLRVRPSTAEAYKLYGMIFTRTGKPRQAETHFGLALDLASGCENRLLQAEIQFEWALLHVEEGRCKDAILFMNRALAAFPDFRTGILDVDAQRQMECFRTVYLSAVRDWGAGQLPWDEPYQAGHASRVANYAELLGERMGVQGIELIWLRVGALIHELGRVADGPAETTDDPLEPGPAGWERRVMIGDSIARRLEFPEEVRLIAKHHREQWDGGGCPDGLSGEAIPFGARIVRIVDAYDSLTSPTGLRAGHTPEEALEIMRARADGVFDPSLWQPLLELVGGAAPTLVGAGAANWM